MANSSYNGFPASTSATLIGNTLAPNVVNSSLTSVGTIVSGVWNGSAIGDSYISSASTWNAKQAALVSGTNIKTVNGISLLGSGNISFLEFGGQIDILYPVDGTKERLSYATFAFTINQIHNLRLTSGSMTLDVKINGVAVTGLNNIAVTTSSQSPSATSNNTVAVGDVITFVTSNASNPIGLLGTIRSTRS